MKMRSWRAGILSIAALTAVAAMAVTARFGATAGDVQISNISMFRLDLMEGGAGPASNWYAIRGGTQILRRPDKTTGQDQSVRTDPGEVEFSPVEVVGPIVGGGSRAEMLQLLNQWATQKGERFNATLELLDSSQQVVRTVHFYDIIPAEYHPPSVRAGDDSLLEESFIFKPERVEDGGTGSPGEVTPGQQAPGRQGFAGTPGAGKNDSTAASPRAANAYPDEVITGTSFRFEIDGRPIPVISVEPGPFRAELQDTAMGNRTTNLKAFTVTKPQFGDWTVEKYYVQGDQGLKQLFEQFASGGRQAGAGITVSLVYEDRNGQPVRRINCFGFAPIEYESINFDTRNPGQVATERLTFSVLRCEYA